jgi:predicted tellurium resistance membrane protein TerC
MSSPGWASPEAWVALAALTAARMALAGEGIDRHIPRGDIDCAMAFSVGVEMLNIRVRRRAAPSLHEDAPPER